MLTTEAEFPLAGSTAYLRPDGQKVRIHQRLPGGIAMVTVDERFKKATSSRRVELADLAATEAEATAKSKRKRAA